MERSPRDRLALALDNVPSLRALSTLILATAPSIGTFKIGLELFIRFGPPICNIVRDIKRKVFLDLKLHDIPHTVEKAVQSACDLEVDYLTIHTQGGISMMHAALASRQQRGRMSLKIIGVTLLTSIDMDCLQKELLVTMRPSDYVRHLALLAVKTGLDGIVCSAADLPAIKPLLPSEFDIITPGIRPAGITANDQKRIATPKEAIKNGATLLVLGRAVTDAPDPAKAAEVIKEEISQYL